MLRPETSVRPLERPSVVTPVEAEVSYTLVHTGEDPDVFPELARRHAGLGLCGPGWSVLAAHGSRWSWSIGLDAHGAEFGAPSLVAQAVAVRVLADHAIHIESWDPPDPDARAYAAVTRMTPTTTRRSS
jgi:hypothetical protein